MLIGIHHINIVVTDLGKSREFFELFGFSVFHEKELKGDWIDKIAGLPDIHASYIALKHDSSDLTLELLQYHKPEGSIDPQISSPNGIGYRHLAFEVDNLEHEVLRLEKAGIKFFSGIQTNPYGKKMCYFTGPDGILLELLEL